MISVYLARGMSGRNKAEVVKEAKTDKAFFEAAGIKVLCPVEKEHVKAENKKLEATVEAMQNYWPADKAMIREASAVIDMTPHLNSEGSKHEIGYARFHLWKPVLRVFPLGKLPSSSSVAFFEDDVVVDSKEEAIEWLYRVYGTPSKRFLWKIRLLNRCFVKFLLIRIAWFFDWV